MSNQEVAQAHASRPEVISYVVAGVMVGSIALMGAYGYGRTTGYDQGFQAAGGNGDEVDAAPTTTIPVPEEQYCVGGVKEFELKDISEATKEVAKTPFAMDQERLSVLQTRLYEAEDYDGVEQVMNDVFSTYGVEVVVGELPEGTELIPGTNQGYLTHDPEQFDLELLQISSFNILHSLQGIPDDMMHLLQGTEIHLTAGLAYGDEREPIPFTTDFTGFNRHASDPTNNNYKLIIGVGANDPTAYSFRYGLAARLSAEMCNTGNFDLEFAKLNEEAGFEYAQGPDAQEQAVKERQVVAIEAASSQTADEHINILALFEYGMTICINDTDQNIDLACRKRELMARRLTALYPEMASVITVQTLSPSDSPADSAKQFLLTAEAAGNN